VLPKRKSNRTKIMKTKNIATWIAITLLTAGTAVAQGGPGRGGRGSGTPPKTAEERAARQVERQQATIDNRATRAGPGMTWRRGQGRANGTAQGRGWGNGPRDGSGPCGGTANCPVRN
jgi:hypothetical protein